eukprot:6692391-Karenia_brevis.AAC.1
MYRHRVIGGRHPDGAPGHPRPTIKMYRHHANSRRDHGDDPASYVVYLHTQGRRGPCIAMRRTCP